jgi:hypothetical protein
MKCLLEMDLVDRNLHPSVLLPNFLERVALFKWRYSIDDCRSG